MSANLPQKTLAINTWLKSATSELEASGSPSARLDSEIILAHTIKQPRTFLHAHPEYELNDRQHEIADARLTLRLDHVPIAYIIGHKEFYGRKFSVTSATLIPRPESETMIDLLKEFTNHDSNARLVDVGTGSGCLGITAKLEFPNMIVSLLDISLHALKVAERNASLLYAVITTLRSNLLDDYDLNPDIILANLPYVDVSWERSPETEYEPELALFAESEGLSLINRLLDQTHYRLSSHGFIYLEADIRQHKTIIETATIHGLNLMKQQGFILVFQKNA